MTANISEHLKKTEWPEQSAWEGVELCWKLGDGVKKAA